MNRAAILAAPALALLAIVGPANAQQTLPTAVAQVEAPALGDTNLPVWIDAGDMPPPAWARSVQPTKLDAAFYMEPGSNQRRGSAQLGARLPFFATKRAAGCQGRWLEVGPFAWVCSDVADYAGDVPYAEPLGGKPWLLAKNAATDLLRPSRPGTRALPPLDPQSANDDGLPYRYYFAGQGGAYGFSNLGNALDDAPDQELEQGFAVAIVEEKTAHDERWGRTRKGNWIAMRELVPARPSLFHGELVDAGKLDLAWVITDKASVFATEKGGQPIASHTRFDKLHVKEEQGTGSNAMVRIEDGWMHARDVSRPRVTSPPEEVGGVATLERWIDVDLASQSLVAYEGKRPVFATIVSTGRGAPGTDSATPPGVHRIWVKIFTTKMDNLEKDDLDTHYALEDVPWVQFFDKAVALHGVFWHRDFGHVHSHGCVNLAPTDARWLYAFTSPHLPVGWTAVYPTKVEQGTAIRVH